MVGVPGANINWVIKKFKLLLEKEMRSLLKIVKPDSMNNFEKYAFLFLSNFQSVVF